MKKQNQLFIRREASRLSPGLAVRATSLESGRMVWWKVDSVSIRETVLKRPGHTLRLSSRCTVLVPLSQDPVLS